MSETGPRRPSVGMSGLSERVPDRHVQPGLPDDLCPAEPARGVFLRAGLPPRSRRGGPVRPGVEPPFQPRVPEAAGRLRDCRLFRFLRERLPPHPEDARHGRDPPARAAAPGAGPPGDRGRHLRHPEPGAAQRFLRPVPARRGRGGAAGFPRCLRGARALRRGKAGRPVPDPAGHRRGLCPFPLPGRVRRRPPHRKKGVGGPVAARADSKAMGRRSRRLCHGTVHFRPRGGAGEHAPDGDQPGLPAGVPLLRGGICLPPGPVPKRRDPGRVFCPGD